MLRTYGELTVLGINGRLPHLHSDRMREKFVLKKRPKPNGIKRSTHNFENVPSTSQKKHFISFWLSKSNGNTIEYVPDDETDMFQVGRDLSAPNHIVVSSRSSENALISRFACRIIVDRLDDSHCARIYAGGFDSSRTLFLGRNALTWGSGETMDGLTTNGVWIKHPGNDWCEVSVCGHIFTTREKRSSPTRGNVVDSVNNVLQDGTLIDLCGATLLWRSADGLEKSPNVADLLNLVSRVNAGRFLCPVDLTKLVIDCSDTQEQNKRQPYIYLNCGHLQSHHRWRSPTSETYTCAVCKTDGPIVRLRMGMEYAFYKEGPDDLYAFNPCGHTATTNTVCYWSTTEVPTKFHKLHVVCPFCYKPLSMFNTFTRLYFS